jgi:uncharacterized membrane protein
MDALKRDAAILRALLLAGPGIPIVLIAFVAFMLAVLSDEQRAKGFQFCMLFAVICLVARASWRVRMLCESAGRLGVAHHATAMQRAQCIIVGAFIAIPTAVALWLGADFHAFVIFVGGTALAIYISEAALLGVVLVILAKGLAAAGADVDIWALVFGIPGSVLILVASAWGIAHWLRLAPRLESVAGAASSTLADSAHEAVESGEFDDRVAIAESVDEVLRLLPRESLSPRRLWIGMGHDPRGNWRRNAAGLAVLIVALVAIHFWKHSRWDLGVYWAASALFGAHAFGRFQQMNEAWLRTAGEQSLLVLCARWPSRAELKVILLRSVWTGIPALLIEWLLFSATTLLLGWIELPNALLALLALATGIVSMFGIFFSYFAHSRMRATNLLPLAYLLTALVGTTILIVATATGRHVGMWLGAGLVLVPFAVTLLAFAYRPLLFPVQIVSRKSR